MGSLVFAITRSPTPQQQVVASHVLSSQVYVPMREASAGKDSVAESVSYEEKVNGCEPALPSSVASSEREVCSREALRPPEPKCEWSMCLWECCEVESMSCVKTWKRDGRHGMSVEIKGEEIEERV